MNTPLYKANFNQAGCDFGQQSLDERRGGAAWPSKRDEDPRGEAASISSATRCWHHQ